ncbi:MAG: GNAT family N-acetyltransferase [Lentimicrobium sp.]|nr:GNAT family N-acetyltransferase [Lentimicrobium sp.]
MSGIQTTTWWLEMKNQPAVKAEQTFAENCMLMQMTEPVKSFYLFLYTSVGRPYQWYNRLMMSPQELHELLNSKGTSIWILYIKGVPAGFVEFNISESNETEIVYFGLTCDFTGRGLGLPFLKWCISKAWERPIDRLWLHTCDLDHKAALGIYKKAGFTVYDKDTVYQEKPDPEDDPYLLLPW